MSYGGGTQLTLSAGSGSSGSGWVGQTYDLDSSQPETTATCKVFEKGGTDSARGFTLNYGTFNGNANRMWIDVNEPTSGTNPNNTGSWPILARNLTTGDIGGSVEYTVDDWIEIGDYNPAPTWDSVGKFQLTSSFSWSSGSGGGSGIQTLSGGTEPEIINVTFTRVNEFDIDLEFEYQNLGNVNVKKILADGTETVATISPSGYSTSTSGEGKITYTLSYGDTWWLEHPPSDLYYALPRYKLERVKWTLNKVSGNLTAKGWFPDNGGNGFGANYDVGLSAYPFHAGIEIVDRAFKSTTQEHSLVVQYNPGTRYRVLNIDTSQFGSTFKTKTGTRGSRNFW